MDQLITFLTNLLNLTKVAAVTLPGLLLSGAFAVMLWPAAPIDPIPVAHPVSNLDERYATIASLANGKDPSLPDACSVSFETLPEDSRRDFPSEVYKWQLIDYEPKRQNELRREEEQVVRYFPRLHVNPELLSQYPQAVRTQLLLDLEQIRWAECQDAENELRQIWKTQSDFLASDLASLEKDRATKIGGQLSAIQNEIEAKRESLSIVKEAIGKQDAELAAWKRYSDLIASRLADPGRLRPRLDFNAFVSVQTNHVVGFIILSIALGVVIAPIRDALFGLLARKLSPWQ